MKKDILILAALIAVVIAVPFLATKAEEAIQIKNEEFKEKQNRECYEKAEECMNAGKYDEAIELLEKLPGYYEDVEYIIQYAKFCDAVQNGEGIEEGPERYRRTIQKIYGTERKRRGRKNEKKG